MACWWTGWRRTHRLMLRLCCKARLLEPAGSFTTTTSLLSEEHVPVESSCELLRTRTLPIHFIAPPSRGFALITRVCSSSQTVSRCEFKAKHNSRRRPCWHIVGMPFRHPRRRFEQFPTRQCHTHCTPSARLSCSRSCIALPCLFSVYQHRTSPPGQAATGMIHAPTERLGRRPSPNPSAGAKLAAIGIRNFSARMNPRR